MKHLAYSLPLLLALALQAGCDDGPGSTGPKEPLSFATSGGCGDAYFWATNEADDRAVVVSAELRDRSTTAMTTIDVTLPDPRVEVLLQEGNGLASTMCSDLPQGEVSGSTPVTSGRVVLTIDPPGKIGETSGTAELTDLVADDGTRLPDTAITTELIGFRAG